LENNPNEQVIIFSNFSSYLKRLHEKVKESRFIIGDTDLKQRQEIVDSFQAGKTRVVLANIQAAGTGLTLDAAGTVIFLDRSFVPSDNDQAEDRIIPTTQQANQGCTIIDLACENSIDETINDMLKAKKNIIEVVNNYRNIKELL
jgi:SNF2 family DNA or RNA helicase